MEIKGQQDNLEICIPKGQIVKSSNFKGNMNSEDDEENSKPAEMKKIENFVVRLNDGRKEGSQVLNSFCREKYSSEVLAEENTKLKFVAGAEEKKK